MIRLGATYFPGRSGSIQAFFEMCHDLGLQYVEIQAEYPYSPADLNKEKVIELREMFSGYGLTPLVHGPVYDINLASTKEPIRQASVEITKDFIELARTLDSQQVVIHAGKCPQDQVSFLLDRARECALLSISKLAHFANDLGVSLGIENKQRGADREIVLTVNDHLRMTSKVQHLGVFAVLDIGHAFTTGEHVTDYIHALKNSLREIHFHDNYGVTDDHLALGHGNVPLEEVVQELRVIDFNGISIIEVKQSDDLKASVKFLMNLDYQLSKTG
jgi:sugar phosphate isomerase/epimerase